MPEIAMKTIYQGGCHCGAVRFEAGVDIALGTSRCNCSYCGKIRLWKADAMAADVRLHCGSDAISEYRFGSRNVLLQFRRICGIKLFDRVEVEGQPLVVVSVAALDVSDELLGSANIKNQDGLHDVFDRKPEEIRYL